MMFSSEEANHQKELLETHRQRLAHYLHEQAVHGPGHVPFVIQGNITDARKQIQQIKSLLRANGFVVDDLPDDQVSIPDHSSAAHTIQPTSPSRWRRHLWLSIAGACLLLLLIAIVAQIQFAGGGYKPVAASIPGTPAEILSPITITPPAHTTIITSTQASLSPTSLPWAGLLRITETSMCGVHLRVLPSTIDPDNNPADALRKLREGLPHDEALTWPIAPRYAALRQQNPEFTDEFHTLLNITGLPTNQEWVQIGRTVSVEIEASDKVPEHVNVLMQEGQCGIGMYRDFTAIQLKTDVKSYSQNLTFSGSDYFSIKPGETEIFAFYFNCTSPNRIYQFHIKDSYTYQGHTQTVDWPGISKLVCPQSYTVWQLSNGGFGLVVDYEWDGKKYVQK